MVSHTGSRVVRLNSCKGSNLRWKRAKGPNKNFGPSKCHLGIKFLKISPKKANLATLVKSTRTLL